MFNMRVGVGSSQREETNHREGGQHVAGRRGDGGAAIVWGLMICRPVILLLGHAARCCAVLR